MTLVVDAHMHIVPSAEWFPAGILGAEKHWWREVRWRGEKSTPEYFAAAVAEMPDPDASKTLARMDEAGIEVAVTLPMDHGINFGDEGMTPIAEQNRISCEYAAMTGGRIVSFCGVDPRRPGAADYPEVQFIIGHSGRWEGWSKEAFIVAVYKTNVLLDISLWQHWAGPDEICKALLWLKDRVGLDRVLFGSDMIGIEVSWTLAQWIDQVRSFGELSKQHGGEITAEELDLVLGGNAVRVMGLEAPAGVPA